MGSGGGIASKIDSAGYSDNVFAKTDLEPKNNNQFEYEGSILNEHNWILVHIRV